MCDGIIDCLSGEDEVNCDPASQFTGLNKNFVDSNSKKLDKVNQSSSMFTRNSNRNDFDIFSTTTILPNSTDNDVNTPKNLNKVFTELDNLSLENEFEHASTLEISTTDTSEEKVSKQISNEDVTIDPITTTETLETQTLSFKASNNILDSMSQLKENNKFPGHEVLNNSIEMKNYTKFSDNDQNILEDKKLNEENIDIDKMTTVDLSDTSSPQNSVIDLKFNEIEGTSQKSFLVESSGHDTTDGLIKHFSNSLTTTMRLLENTITTEQTTTTTVSEFFASSEKLNQPVKDQHTLNKTKVSLLRPAKEGKHQEIPSDFQCRR